LSLEENRASGNAERASTGIEVLATPEPDTELWWCEIAPVAARLDAYEQWLSPAERDRASRFGNPRLRDRYVMGRGTLRSIIAGSFGTDPASVEIVRGTRGRPQLAGAPALDFNISHTAGVAIVGTTRRGRIGVDVERLDRAINVTGIARTVLTRDERSAIASLDADAKRQRVLTLWTCKEAMSKATGDGLLAPFRHIDVDLSAAPRLVGGPAPYRPAAWTLVAAPVPAEHFATVALWDRT
jgi:4'-phosphopantetheinyl transferase